MSRLFIDDRAIRFIKKELLKENAPAMRIFTGGGGCCERFELSPVKKPLAGDAAFMQGGVKVYVEKELVENTSAVYIKYDEQKGLIIEFQ